MYKPLAELFKVGNYVVCYVKQINFENKWSVTLSLDPKFVNQNVIGEHLKKGSLVACSVASVEDHGFVMDTGIKTLRAFLKTTDADSETKYCKYISFNIIVFHARCAKFTYKLIQ